MHSKIHIIHKYHSFIKASTALIRSYRNAALCTGRFYFMEEEKARNDSKKGYFGYWRNCQWVRSSGGESGIHFSREESTVSTATDDSSCLGNNCQTGSSTSGSGALVNYESDSSDDTG